MKPLRNEAGQNECPLPELAAAIEAALAGAAAAGGMIPRGGVVDDYLMSEREQWEALKRQAA